ncbi:MAG: ABC transporter permease, partial [Deltaproteobacteria bacterium]|nr:ABC transporter permease [Deltaproteobacteria bacterium]
FLCGIFLPLENMPVALRILARLLPLTYSVESLKATMIGSTGNVLLNTLILAGYSALLLALSVTLFRKNQE